MSHGNLTGAGASVPDTSAPQNVPIPQARFRREGQAIVVYPSTGNKDQPNAFALCQFPKSLADELASTCLWFWQRHHRCLGFLLLLEPKVQHWIAVIPAQRVSRDSSCWTASRSDIPADRPDAILMGSFQSRILPNLAEASDCPPPHDGIHLVMCINSQSSVGTFVRCDGQTVVMPYSAILFDQNEQIIERALGKLTFT